QAKIRVGLASSRISPFANLTGKILFTQMLTSNLHRRPHRERRLTISLHIFFVFCLLSLPGHAGATSAAAWHGVLLSQAKAPVANAAVRLHSAAHGQDYVSRTSAQGEFEFNGLAAGRYSLTVVSNGRTCNLPGTITLQRGVTLTAGLQLCSGDQ